MNNSSTHSPQIIDPAGREGRRREGVLRLLTIDANCQGKCACMPLNPDDVTAAVEAGIVRRDGMDSNAPQQIRSSASQFQ